MAISVGRQGRGFFLQDENRVAGLTAGRTFATQSGRSDTDDGTVVEKGLLLPYSNTPDTTFIAWHNEREVRLDAGMALHKPLPQTSDVVDNLGVVDVDDPGDLSAWQAPGSNLASQSTGTDVIQKMATSTYTFILRGFGLRVAFPVPVPRLVQVAGVPATPAEVQRVVESVEGNYGGVPLFFASWELWYYVKLPPKKSQVPPANLAARIRGDSQLPQGGFQAPYGVPDTNAVSQQLSGFFTGGTTRR